MHRLAAGLQSAAAAAYSRTARRTFATAAGAAGGSSGSGSGRSRLGSKTALSLEHFLQRSRALALYRTIVRGTRQISDPTTRAETRRFAREEFERHRAVTDLVGYMRRGRLTIYYEHTRRPWSNKSNRHISATSSRRARRSGKAPSGISGVCNPEVAVATSIMDSWKCFKRTKRRKKWENIIRSPACVAMHEFGGDDAYPISLFVQAKSVYMDIGLPSALTETRSCCRNDGMALAHGCLFSALLLWYRTSTPSLSAVSSSRFLVVLLVSPPLTLPLLVPRVR